MIYYKLPSKCIISVRVDQDNHCTVRTSKLFFSVLFRKSIQKLNLKTALIRIIRPLKIL